METIRESTNKKVNVVYVFRFNLIAIIHYAVLISESAELKASEVEKLQQSLPYQGKLITEPLGKYDLSKIGKGPGIYKDNEAKEILRKIGRQDLT